ncbi:MAG: hypothetical protein WAJ94_12220 [Candidatus Cybelea sp.]
MMTERIEVSILAAPLAAIDRRALSQAWYSALYFDRRQTRPSEKTVQRSHAGTVASQVRQRAKHPSLERNVESRQTKRSSPRAAQAHHVPSVVRTATPRTIFPLSCRIERTFFRAKAPVRRATFSLGRGGARVHVILQSNAGAVTLVALCRPEMRELVARALAQARLTLATRGFEIAELSEGEPLCS